MLKHCCIDEPLETNINFHLSNITKVKVFYLFLCFLRQILKLNTYGSSAKLSYPPKLSAKVKILSELKNFRDSAKPPVCLKLNVPE